MASSLGLSFSAALGDATCLEVSVSGALAFVGAESLDDGRALLSELLALSLPAKRLCEEEPPTGRWREGCTFGFRLGATSSRASSVRIVDRFCCPNLRLMRLRGKPSFLPAEEEEVPLLLAVGLEAAPLLFVGLLRGTNFWLIRCRRCATFRSVLLFAELFAFGRPRSTAPRARRLRNGCASNRRCVVLGAVDLRAGPCLGGDPLRLAGDVLRVGDPRLCRREPNLAENLGRIWPNLGEALDCAGPCLNFNGTVLRGEDPLLGEGPRC